MKLGRREHVEGSQPPTAIGHRLYRDKNTGEPRMSAQYTAEFTLDGRQRQFALKTTDRGTAIRKVHDILTKLNGGEQIHRPRKRATIAEVMASYIALVEDQGRARKTLQKYRLVERDLAEHLGSRVRDPAATFDESAYWRMRRWYVEAKGVEEKTAYDRLVIVRQAFKRATRSAPTPGPGRSVASGGGGASLAGNPLAGISHRKPESSLQPCFTPSEVARLLATAEGWLKPVVTMLAYTGVRAGEMCELRWEDLLLDQGPHGYVLVRRGGSGGKSSDTTTAGKKTGRGVTNSGAGGGGTKNRKSRRIPIHPELRGLLDRLPRRSDRVFTRPATRQYPEGRPVEPRRLLPEVKKLCRRAGLPNPQRYKTHTFRHAFASMCACNNVSYKYALEWMGHSSSKILDIYYTMFDETAIRAMATIRYEQHGEAA